MRRMGWTSGVATLATVLILLAVVVGLSAPPPAVAQATPSTAAAATPNPEWLNVLVIQELARRLESQAIDIYLTDPGRFPDLRRALEDAFTQLPMPRVMCIEPAQCTPPLICCNGVCRRSCGPQFPGDRPRPSLPPSVPPR